MNTLLNTRFASAVLIVSFLICSRALPANGETAGSFTNDEKYVDEIAFLFEGEVCSSRLDGSDLSHLTQTNGKVRDFRFSPDLQYLAYTAVIGMVEDVGLWEEGEEVSETEIWSINIVNLSTMKVVAEIEPEGEWLYFGRWFASDRLIYYSSSGFDISGFYQYDSRTNNTVALDYLEGNKLLHADFSADGSQMLYVDDVGLGKNFHYRLHVLDLKTNNDNVVASKKRIRNQALSHDQRSVAYVEIQSDTDEAVAIVWEYNLVSESTKELITLPAKTKGVSSLSWSAGDSHIGLFYSPSYSLNGYVFPVADASDVHEISGRQFCWIGDDAILYTRGASGIFVYDLKTKEERMLITNATHPVYLKRIK
jgi:hypothetical protein